MIIPPVLDMLTSSPERWRKGEGWLPWHTSNNTLTLAE